MHYRRRDLFLASLAAGLPLEAAPLIRSENNKPGTRDWQLTKVRANAGKGFRSTLVEGYCSHQSVEAGERLSIFLSANPARRCTIDVYRMGYYQGAGARLVTQLGPVAVKPQPDPPVGAMRLRECQWTPSVELKIPADWVSGVYLGKLTTVSESKHEHAWQSYVVFVVRDRRRAGIVFQVSDNTWAAYNRWPDDYSLYTDPRHSWAPRVAVSFDRPYAKYAQIYDHPLSIGSGEYLLWEYPLAYWLEMLGYDVTYTSNSDMVAPEQFLRGRVFLSVGHDEYWDPRQYDGALASVSKGVTHLYLSGNAVFGVTPYRAASDGRPQRILTREGVYGGMYSNFGDFFKEPFPMEGPKANRLIGAHSVYPFNGGDDWICTAPRHWMFDGTNMKAGERIPGLVGWEFHGDPADIAGLEIVAEGDALSGGVRPSHWTSTIYPGPEKNFVFNASTIWWAQGLASAAGTYLAVVTWGAAAWAGYTGAADHGESAAAGVGREGKIMTAPVKRFPAMYHDGRSSAEIAVQVVPAPHGIAVTMPDGTQAWWPFDGLFVQRGSQQIVFRKAHPVNEAVTVTDGEFLMALERMNPRVAGGQAVSANSQFLLQIGALAAGVLVALVALVYFGFPWLVDRMVRLVPVAVEQKLGEASLAALAPPDKRCTDPSVQRIVRVLEKAAPENPYTFRVYVVEDPMVNAFAAPGGYMVIYRGLLDKTRRPEEAAAVLAHEMQHVLQRHSMRGMMRGLSIYAGFLLLTGSTPEGLVGLAGNLGNLHYQRGDETQADVEGLNLLLDAGIDPEAMVSMLELLDRVAGDVPALARYVSSHPMNKERIERIRELAMGRGSRRTLDVKSAWPPPKSACVA